MAHRLDPTHDDSTAAPVAGEAGAAEVRAADVEDLVAWLKAHTPVMVLTGAGCSTASGIPDYRDDQGQWKRSPPLQYREFVGSAAVRQRYWARSFLGWPKLQASAPNAAHAALAALAARGFISRLVTQNVDGLHQAGGSADVLELHGDLRTVICLSCQALTARVRYQEQLLASNPTFFAESTIAPDGDADIRSGDFSGFVVPDCACGGVIKPNVVFFGESVPKDRVELAYATLASARGLLIAGSSLMVFSGYRFARAAAQDQRSIALVNHGQTRADAVAALKVSADCPTVLAQVARALTS